MYAKYAFSSAIRFHLTSSTNGANDSSLLSAACTAYVILGRFGDSVTKCGFTIPRRLQICWCVILIAVTERAILQMSSGTRLLASPILKNVF